MKLFKQFLDEGLISSETLAKVSSSVPQNLMVGNRPAANDIPAGAKKATQMQNVPVDSPVGSSSSPSKAGPPEMPEPEEPPKPGAEEDEQDTEGEGEGDEETPPEESVSLAQASLRLAEHYLGEMEKDLVEGDDEIAQAIREAREKIRFVLKGKSKEKEQDQSDVNEPVEEQVEDHPEMETAGRFLEWAKQSNKHSDLMKEKLTKLFTDVPRVKVEAIVSGLDSVKEAKRDAIIEMMRKVFRSKD